MKGKERGVCWRFAARAPLPGEMEEEERKRRGAYVCAGFAPYTPPLPPPSYRVVFLFVKFGIFYCTGLLSLFGWCLRARGDSFFFTCTPTPCGSQLLG